MSRYINESEIFYRQNNVKLRKNFLKYILTDFNDFPKKDTNEIINWLLSGKFEFEPYTEFYKEYLFLKNDDWIKTRINLLLDSLKNTKALSKSCHDCDIPEYKVNIWIELGKNHEYPFDIFYKEYKKLSMSFLEERIKIFLDVFNGFNEDYACDVSNISKIQLASWLRLNKLGGIFKILYNQYLKILSQNDYSEFLDFKENKDISQSCIDMLFLLSDVGKTCYNDFYKDYYSLFSIKRKNYINYPESYIEQFLDSFHNHHKMGSLKLLNPESINTCDVLDLVDSKNDNQIFYKENNIDDFLKYVALGYDDYESAKLANIKYGLIDDWLNNGIFELPYDTFFEDYNSSLIMNNYLDFIYHKLNSFISYLKDGNSLKKSTTLLSLSFSDVELYLNLGYLGYEPYTVFYKEFEKISKNIFYEKNNLNVFLNDIEKGFFKHHAARVSRIKVRTVNEFIKKGKEDIGFCRLFLIDYKIALIKNYKVNKDSDNIYNSKFDLNPSQISQIPDDVIEFWISLNILKEFKISYFKSKDPKFFTPEVMEGRKVFLDNILRGMDKSKACENLPFSEEDVDKWLQKGKLNKEPYDEFYKGYLNYINPYFKDYNIQAREVFLNDIEEGFSQSQIFKRHKLPSSDIKNWLQLGADGEKPYVEFYNDYLKVNESYFNQENIQIRETFLNAIEKGILKDDAIEKNNISSNKINNWLSHGFNGKHPYTEFYKDYINARINNFYRRNKLNIFLDEIESTGSKEIALKKARISENEFKLFYSRGEALHEVYYKFYTDYNNALENIFNSENDLKRKRFLEEYAGGLSFEEALNIADLSKNYIQKCFNLKDEAAFFHNFYKQYLRAESTGYYLRSQDNKNKFIKYIQDGETIDDACKYAELNPNKIKSWISSGKAGNSKYEDFYEDYLNATIKFFSLKEIDEKKDIFTNLIREGKNYKEACSKSNLDVKNVDKWISLGKNNISPFMEFKKEYDDAITDFFYSEEFDKKQDVFLKSIENGEIITDACKLAGFNNNLVNSWLVKGKNGKKPYLNFYEKYNQSLINQFNKFENKIDDFFNLISNGETIKNACEILGLNSKMINMWITQGRKGEELYLNFFEEYSEIKNKK